jgi:hypothetical protein
MACGRTELERFMRDEGLIGAMAKVNATTAELFDYQVERR